MACCKIKINSTFLWYIYWQKNLETNHEFILGFQWDNTEKIKRQPELLVPQIYC
jgi:hypothetical protein